MLEPYNYNKTPDFEAGELLIIDKPVGWTSFDVVNKIRWQLKNITKNKKIKVGHAGTLDPLATGVLLVCTGKYTKKIESIQSEDKVYEATIRLGATTPSFDLETNIDKTFPYSHITEEQIISVIRSMEGIRQQTPPIYSAVQINGKRAYEYARKGQTVEIKSREINIKKIELNNISLPDVTLTIYCSKGTYIRTIADDFGRQLDSGSFLYCLRRVQSGNYAIKDALQLKELIEFLNNL